MMAEEQTAWVKKMQAPCACGSGKLCQVCCGATEATTTPCPCGSGKMYSECCMKSPETHEAM